MASRKDNKGRVLPPNMSQKSDGRYIWRKTISGHTYIVTDNTLSGLKEKAAQKESDIRNGVCVDVKKITLNQYFDKYIELKGNLKKITKENYKNYWKWYLRDSKIGNKQLSSILNSDIVEVYEELGKKMKYQTIQYVNNILSNCLECAVIDDKLIPYNPCKRALTKIKKTEPKEKKALTIQQQELLVDFIANSDVYSIYLPLFSFLLGTGARIGEATGITWNDIDFKNNCISINHTLNYKAIDGRHIFFITKPKTKTGTREIPMIADLRRELNNQRKNQIALGMNKEYAVDDYKGFVFTTRSGNPIAPGNVNRTIKSIIEKCNEQESEKAKKENRESIELPHFTAHTLRHTFCTRFCENETNIKVIQEIMGHSNIKTTMDIYSHATKEKKTEAMSALNGKIKIS